MSKNLRRRSSLQVRNNYCGPYNTELHAIDHKVFVVWYINFTVNDKKLSKLVFWMRLLVGHRECHTTRNATGASMVIH